MNPYVPTYVRTWPLGKLEPPSGAITTRTCSGSGRGRLMKPLTTVEIPPVPHARNWNAASVRRPMTYIVVMASGGMTRLCGGKPGHETPPIRRAEGGYLLAWTCSVMATSIAVLRLALTVANRAPKPTSAAPATYIPLRPRRSDSHAGTVARLGIMTPLTATFDPIDTPRASPRFPARLSDAAL